MNTFLQTMPVITFAGEALFLLLVALLHVLKPELDPSWRMISEYARGRFGWIMRFAFFASATSIFALVIVLYTHVSLAALILLGLAGSGVVGAGLFVTDAITVPRDRTSRTGYLHAFFSALFILGFPVAATLIGRDLPHSVLVAPLWTWLPWMSVAVVGSCVAFMGLSAFTGGRRGELESQGRLGLAQRLMVTTYVAWLMIVAWTLWTSGLPLIA